MFMRWSKLSMFISGLTESRQSRPKTAHTTPRRSTVGGSVFAGARAAIRRNVEALGLTGATKIWRRDATRLGPAGNITPFDLVFCDPPYGKGLGEKALAAAAEGGWLAAGATLVLEERVGTGPAWPVLFEEIDRRRYGDTEIAMARRTG